ncbi:hypothetical protein C7T94_08615 [Pedobacter yulinensis]|uniref:Secretin/TonB short N-terminal domain-containing protein n=1 Tax=Pedobacter yulinensis TaxID=2126353 RepID=A0A2T3HJT4_9SPHI|nr:TonB-dependent receptor [Pedobacter yulinensis]PST82708.1 hypothetical protein C7T94_08615 [Pedobacter yulinensis]
MNFNALNSKACVPHAPIRKLILIMKITTLLVFMVFSQIRAEVNAQVSISMKNAPIKKVMDSFHSQTGYEFLFVSELLADAQPVTVELKNASAEQALEKIFRNQPFTYRIIDRTIVIRPVSGKAGASKQDSSFSLKGRVFDSAEPPHALAGANVALKGSSVRTSTDENGNFEIPVRRNQILLVTFTGFKPREYAVTGPKNNITISLEEEVTLMNEVVVTGYGEQKVKTLASSFSSMNIKANVSNKPITQLSQSLQGGVTGITVRQGSGLPGGDGANILIRGISTIGSTSPLVLVDGVPFNINDVDPNTVESINVLKDAAAASVYGARAANGVILITTKRGVPGKVVIAYDGYGGYQRASFLPEFVDGPTYLRLANEASINTGGAQLYSDEYISNTAAGTDPLKYPNTDWSELILKKNPEIHSHSLAVSGGNELARFAVSGNYLYQDGITPLRDFTRYSFRANTGVTLSKQLSMLLDLVLQNGVNQSEISRFGFGNPLLRGVYSTPPNIVPKYPLRADGLQSYGNFGDMQNPLAEVERGGYARYNYNIANINFQPIWKITPELKARGQYLYKVNSGGSLSNRDVYSFIDYYTNALQYTYSSIKTQSTNRNSYNYLALNLEYTKEFDKHSVYALGGFSRESSGITNFDIVNLASYFVKANYVYNDRYIIEGTIRTDGSSRFGPGQQWGAFPSGAIGWNIGNEDFLKNLKFVQKFKLRASYGLLGNNENAQLYQYQSLIDANNGRQTTLGNPAITWETVKMVDIGADLTLFNNLNITADWFDKTTQDILLSPALPLSSGFGLTVPVNSGSVKNTGWELALNYTHAFANDFNLSAGGGFSYYRNKVVTLLGGPYTFNLKRIAEGQPISSYYLYRTDGLLQETDIAANVPRLAGSGAGDIKYLDLNKDGEITEADRELLGNSEPQGNYFANLTLNYKGIELETQLNGFTNSLGYYSGRYQMATTNTSTGGTPMRYQTDYWTPANTTARLPRILPTAGTNALASDFWLFNAAFCRIRYIQLAYNFRQDFVRKMGLSSLRVFVNSQNPVTFSKNRLLDPETQGDEGTYPLMQINTVGLNVKF